MAQPRQPNFPKKFPALEHPQSWLHVLKNMDGESTRCDYYVHKITYLKFKDRKRLLHEFILIKIVHASSGQALFVLTERSPQKGAAATSRDDRRCSNQMITHSVFGRVAAKDAVQVVGDDHISQLVSSCDKLAELTFDPGKLRPLNLAILLTVVSNYAPNYDILDYQCYWYAATIYQSSKDLFHPSEEFVEAAPSNPPRKYVFGLPPSKDSVRAILVNYKLETKQYRKEKMEKENARRAEEKKIEQRGREMERKKRERRERERQWEYNRKMRESERKVRESERKAQESERKARENEVKAKEALRMLDEVKRVKVEADARPLRRTRARIVTGRASTRCYSLPSQIQDDQLASRSSPSISSMTL